MTCIESECGGWRRDGRLEEARVNGLRDGGGGGDRQLLAHAVLVSLRDAVQYDRHVRISEQVVDYARRYSGIRPADVAPHAPGADELDDVRRAVHPLFFGLVLVGHGLKSNLHVLQVAHPPELRLDTFRLGRHVVWRALLVDLAQSLLDVPAMHAGSTATCRRRAPCSPSSVRCAEGVVLPT